MENGPRGAVTCRNCGRRFEGRFCPDCGQEADEVRRPFAELTRGFLSDVLAFDARIWRTLKPLFLRPGHLTREYFAGHRVRYVPPLRLYVFVGAVFFAVMSITGGGPYRFVVESEGEQRSISFRQSSLITEQPRTDDTVEEEPSATPESAANSAGAREWIVERIDRAVEDPVEFNAAIIDTLSYFHFLMVPLLALLLKAFWRRRYFVEHVVLALHFNALALIPAIVYVVVWSTVSPAPEDRWAKLFDPVWMVALGIWLHRALRGLYGGRGWTTGLRTLAIGWLYMMLGGVLLVVVLFTTIVVAG